MAAEEPERNGKEAAEPLAFSTAPAAPDASGRDLVLAEPAVEGSVAFCRRRSAFGLRVLALLALAAVTITVVRRPPLPRRTAPAKEYRHSASLDLDALDLLVRNFFIHFRASMVEDVQEKVFSSSGPVVTQLDTVTGKWLSVRGMTFNATEPQVKFLATSLTRHKYLDRLYMTLAFDCRSSMTIEMDAVRHVGQLSGVEGATGISNATSAVYRALVQRPLHSVMRRMEGDEDYDLHFAITGQLRGPVEVRVTLEASEEHPFPRPVHVLLTEHAGLRLRLEDYSVGHNLGFGRWIRRLRLVPLGLLERLANTALQRELRDRREGWAIAMQGDRSSDRQQALQRELPDRRDNLATSPEEDQSSDREQASQRELLDRRDGWAVAPEGDQRSEFV